jgi:hypothetical protein
MQEDLERALAQTGEAVTIRDVGASVATLFAPERERRRAAIDECLSRPTDAALSVLPVLGTGNPLSVAPPSFSRTAWDTPTGNETQARPQQGRAAYALALAALAVLVAAVAFGMWLGPGSERAGLSAPIAVASPSVTPVVPSSDAGGEREASLVNISISTQPDGARLFLDDGLLTTNPFRATVRRDGSPHHVRVEARGYVSKTVAIVFDHAQDVVIALERQAPATPPAHPQRPPVAVSPKPPPAERPAAPTTPPPRAHRPLDSSNPWDD